MLVGGRSSRMGRDKALLPVPDGPLAGSIAARVAEVAGNVTLIGPRERYSALGYRVLPDLIPNAGPLGGIYTALHASTADWNLIVACDMPDVTVELFENLFNAAEGSNADCVVPGESGSMHPLCAIYHRRCAARAIQAIHRNSLKMHDFVSDLQAVIRFGRAHRSAGEHQHSRGMERPMIPINGDTGPGTSHYIEFRNVYKTFDRPVLVDVNFSVDPGETLAVIGRSGVGKSVSLGHIMGFIKPDAGHVYGRLYGRHRMRRRRSAPHS